MIRRRITSAQKAASMMTVLKNPKIVLRIAAVLLATAGSLIGGTATAGTATIGDSATGDAAGQPDHTVLERWSAAIEARLAGIDTNAAPIAPPVGPGPALKIGASGERVDRLAAQLVARGFLGAGVYQGQYDEAVEHGVRDFQASEGMATDGHAGDTTIEALDRTPAATAAALKATLTALHTLAADAPREFFLVNIPSQTAYLIAGNTLEMSMRVAVGRPSRPTPLLDDRITDVILNPTWTAPTTVLAKDKLPSLRRTGRPGIEGATIYLDGEEVDPAVVDWSTVTADRLKVVQSPGDQNALGRFKFNLTNGESIYLHDTNDHSVFARQGRAISSGCVRLAEPRQLAELLLGREGWSPERISAAVDRERTQAIGLNRPLPVRIVYWQATVDDGGTVRLYRDIYGRNGQAGAATMARTGGAASPRLASAPQVTPQPQAETAAVVVPPSMVAPVAAPAAAVAPVIHRTPRAAVPPAVVAERVSQAVSPAPRCDGYCGLGLY
jgi:murein L,D-transpeptidase YcbB/YkuD